VVFVTRWCAFKLQSHGRFPFTADNDKTLMSTEYWRTSNKIQSASMRFYTFQDEGSANQLCCVVWLVECMAAENSRHQISASRPRKDLLSRLRRRHDTRWRYIGALRSLVAVGCSVVDYVRTGHVSSWTQIRLQYDPLSDVESLV